MHKRAQHISDLPCWRRPGKARLYSGRWAGVPWRVGSFLLVERGVDERFSSNQCTHAHTGCQGGMGGWAGLGGGLGIPQGVDCSVPPGSWGVFGVQDGWAAWLLGEPPRCPAFQEVVSGQSPAAPCRPAERSSDQHEEWLLWPEPGTGARALLTRHGCFTGINAQARRLQRSRAKGTPAPAAGGTRSPPPPRLRRTVSETSLSSASTRDPEEPGRDTMRCSLYESPHLLLLQGYSQQHVSPSLGWGALRWTEGGAGLSDGPGGWGAGGSQMD